VELLYWQFGKNWMSPDQQIQRIRANSAPRCPRFLPFLSTITG
jgi:hypothetical protein